MQEPEKNQITQILLQAFQPEKAGGMKAVVQVELSGNNGGIYYLRIENGHLEGGEGRVEKPHLTLVSDMQTLMDILQKKSDPMNAFFQGRLQVKGDMGLAMKLIQVFKNPWS